MFLKVYMESLDACFQIIYSNFRNDVFFIQKNANSFIENYDNNVKRFFFFFKIFKKFFVVFNKSIIEFYKIMFIHNNQ
jgi:hypothetical protein